jgi:hypothetical protein
MRRIGSPAVLLVLGAALLVPASPRAQSSTLPEPPRLSVDTTYTAPSGRTLAVGAGGNFQAALNAAQPGDVITLEAGATFVGPFTLPHKPGSGWIIIRTNAPDSSLPPPGARIDPSHAKLMPTLTAKSESVITAAAGAHHYRFIGVEMRPRDDVFLYALVLLGTRQQTSLEQLPHHIIFDRCYLHGDPKKGTRRGIAMNSRYTAVIDSYLADFKEVDADSQAIAGWLGPGPFKIVNNYLEAAGENVMFGGGAPAISGVVPSDIEIRRNHVAKPLSWKVGHSTYAGTPWTVKNLFELKNARRVLIDGNLFERNWAHAQNGFAVLFTVRFEGGAAPWSAVEDVAFTNNIVRHTGSGINMSARDDEFLRGGAQTRRILVKNNLFTDVDGTTWGGDGRLFQILHETAHVVIDHNTAFQTGNPLVGDGPANPGFVFRNNIALHNAYGVAGTGTGPGNTTFRRYFPDSVFEKNVLVGPWPSVGGATIAMYSDHPNNFFPASLERVRFANLAKGDYRLAGSSPYKHAGTDGKDVGVDFEELSAAMASPTPAPR